MKTTDGLTDDELLSLTQGKERRRVRWVTGVTVVLGAVQAVIITRPDAALGGLKIEILSGVMLLGALAINLVLWLTRQPRDSRLPRAMLRRADEFQRKRSRSLLIFAVYAALMTPLIWPAAGDMIEGGVNVRGCALLGSVAVLALIFLALILGPFSKDTRAVFDDEFSRVLRARAVLTGFAALLCGTAGLFALGIANTSLAVQAMPLVLLYTVVATCIAYAVMDLKADRT